MNNPHSYAIIIEHILTEKGFATLHSADEIEKNPMRFLDAVLGIYEKQSEEHEQRAADFWQRYEGYTDKSLKEFEENAVKQLIEDIKALF